MPSLASHRSANQRHDYLLGFDLTKAPGQAVVRGSDVREWHRLAAELPGVTFSATEIPNLRVTSLQAVQAQSPDTLLLLVVETLDLIHNHFSSIEHREGFLDIQRIVVIRNGYHTAIVRSRKMLDLYEKIMELSSRLVSINGRTKISGAVAESTVTSLYVSLSNFIKELSQIRWNSKDHQQVKRLRVV